MRKANKGQGKVYDSMAEIEKDFFPALYSERINEEWNNEQPAATASRLTAQLMNDIKQELRKLDA